MSAIAAPTMKTALEAWAVFAATQSADHRAVGRDFGLPMEGTDDYYSLAVDGEQNRDAAVSLTSSHQAIVLHEPIYSA